MATEGEQATEMDQEPESVGDPVPDVFPGEVGGAGSEGAEKDESMQEKEGEEGREPKVMKSQSLCREKREKDMS